MSSVAATTSRHLQSLDFHLGPPTAVAIGRGSTTLDTIFNDSQRDTQGGLLFSEVRRRLNAELDFSSQTGQTNLKMRVMGLDFGTHRMGVALSDETATIAQPHCTIQLNRALPIAELRRLVEEFEVSEIVIGLPFSLGGESRGRSANSARALGEKIERELAIPVEYWDERFSTTQAERVLKSAGLRRTNRRTVVDKVAAALILQSYLDARMTQHD